MRMKIVGWLLMKKAELTEKKKPHLCEECNKVATPTKRISILNLLAWLVIGIVVGLLLKQYVNIGLSIIVMFLTTSVLTAINTKFIEQSCRSCFSTQIRPVTWAEVKEITEKEVRRKGENDLGLDLVTESKEEKKKEA